MLNSREHLMIVDGKQYLWVNSVGGNSLLGVVMVTLPNVKLDEDVTFLVGIMAGGTRGEAAILLLQEEMATVRRHFPHAARLRCELTWPNRPCDVVEEVPEMTLRTFTLS